MLGDCGMIGAELLPSDERLGNALCSASGPGGRLLSSSGTIFGEEHSMSQSGTPHSRAVHVATFTSVNTPFTQSEVDPATPLRHRSSSSIPLAPPLVGWSTFLLRMISSVLPTQITGSFAGVVPLHDTIRVPSSSHPAVASGSSHTACFSMPPNRCRNWQGAMMRTHIKARSSERTKVDPDGQSCMRREKRSK